MAVKEGMWQIIRKIKIVENKKKKWGSIVETMLKLLLFAYKKI